MEKEFKVCELDSCREKFYRTEKHTDRSWGQKRFCNNSCSSKWVRQKYKKEVSTDWIRYGGGGKNYE